MQMEVTFYLLCSSPVLSVFCNAHHLLLLLPLLVTLESLATLDNVSFFIFPHITILTIQQKKKEKKNFSKMPVENRTLMDRI